MGIDLQVALENYLMALLPQQQAGDLVKAGYEADLSTSADRRAKCLGGQRVVYVIWRNSSHMFLGSYIATTTTIILNIINNDQYVCTRS